MIPASFDYVRPASLEEAIRALTDGGADARPLAGGHSLLPLMKLRFAAPSLLVDLQGLPGLSGIQRENGTLRVGALTRHAQLQDAGLGVISETAHKIADQQVRNRGTIGGSLAHGDSASDWPTVLLTYEGSVTVQGADGQRVIEAGDLFKEYLTTSVGQGEIVTEVHLPTLEGYGGAYEKFTRRAEDWAMVGVLAVVKESDGVVSDVRVGLTHMASTPLRARAVEEALKGQPLTAESIASAAEHADEGTNPAGDLNATTDYKRHLARVLTRRALTRAAGIEG
ncbi:MAG TPA: xanthine dehydrogenase family protein subunit M [Solirubrobacteraceae bacterium]|jgi:carbon-monoxide dehydrogenase medium subunit|nr:xanthine dehydrogenase family protein subunit M [Solirubrobacteraceae bacterium]